MGKILIHGLKAMALIGTLPDEKVHRQLLVLDVELECDLRPAGKNDDLSRSVDYSAVEAAVVRCVEESRFELLESLLTALWRTVAACDKKISGATIRIVKPGASRLGGKIGVEDHFSREAES